MQWVAWVNRDFEGRRERERKKNVDCYGINCCGERRAIYNNEANKTTTTKHEQNHNHDNRRDEMSMSMKHFYHLNFNPVLITVIIRIRKKWYI